MRDRPRNRVEGPLHREIDYAAALHRCHALNRGFLAGLAEKHLENIVDRDGRDDERFDLLKRRFERPGLPSVSRQ